MSPIKSARTDFEYRIFFVCLFFFHMNSDFPLRIRRAVIQVCNPSSHFVMFQSESSRKGNKIYNKMGFEVYTKSEFEGNFHGDDGSGHLANCDRLDFWMDFFFFFVATNL